MKCNNCTSETDNNHFRCAKCRARVMAYCRKPEVKEKRQAYAKSYYQRPEVKDKRQAYAKSYYQRPEVREKRRAYKKAYYQLQKPMREANKAARKEARRIARELRPLRKEYHALLMKTEDKKRPLSVREMRRLEALGDVLGREIDEWRNERQRKEYNTLINNQ